MKKIQPLLILLMLCFVGACNKDSLDSLSGKYDMERYVFDKVEQATTEKIGGGIKVFPMTLSDGTNTMTLTLGSSEWIMPAGVYTPAAAVSNKNQFSAVINGDIVVASGNLEITLLESTYYISGLLSDASGNRFKVDYKGVLSFEVGEDDPEASGYTISIVENQVVDENETVYPELTKYAITVSNPNGVAVFHVDAVNNAGMTLADLVGTYTTAGYPAEAWLADNGWVVYFPEWGVEMGGGTYFTDANNKKQYVTQGSIVITAAEDMNGNPLYSFSGENLVTLTAQNEPGTDGAFSIMFASEVNNGGTVLKDQTITSEVLGMDMKYSVYLPESWDGIKTFPVLYLLHGADGGNNDWITGGKIDAQVAAAVAAGTAPEMIVIMPNCTVDGKNLFYVNGYQGDAQYMTYFFDEFLPTVEALYKVKGDRENRAIGGLSMGGYGSLYYGGIHPEMFSYVYACSPAVMIDGTPNLFDIYGAVVAEEATLPGITLEIGTGDFLYETAGWFKGFMDSMSIDHEYITRDGAHDWSFWMACTPKIVAKLGTLFSEN